MPYWLLALVWPWSDFGTLNVPPNVDALVQVDGLIQDRHSILGISSDRSHGRGIGRQNVIKGVAVGGWYLGPEGISERQGVNRRSVFQRILAVFSLNFCLSLVF